MCVGILCTVGSGAIDTPHCQVLSRTIVLPTEAEGRRTIDEHLRPRANSWQIAGVWISTAALLIAAVKAAVELWPLFK